MVLVNGSNLEHIRVNSKGLLKFTDSSKPEEYRAVKDSIKVKLAQDMFVVVTSVESREPFQPYRLHISVLRSTGRKFKTEYVSEVFGGSFVLSEDKQILRRINT